MSRFGLSHTSPGPVFTPSVRWGNPHPFREAGQVRPGDGSQQLPSSPRLEALGKFRTFLDHRIKVESLPGSPHIFVYSLQKRGVIGLLLTLEL